jgi:hypothetical protein
MKDMKQFESGAVRGIESSNARYDLITPVGLRRLAETYGEGAVKYGDENWLKGIDCKNLMNHALTHLTQYLAGDRTEDHLAHASWNLFAIMHNEEKMPHLQNITARNPTGQLKEMVVLKPDGQPVQLDLPFYDKK